MGLDISWYRGLIRAVGTEGLDDDGEAKYDEGWHTLYENPDFPGRCDDVPRGRYRADESGGFHCGAYSTYSRWREKLAALVGYPVAVPSHFEDPDSRRYAEHQPHSMGPFDPEIDDEVADALPFIELIAFSDCEGTIGTAVSAKLAADFAAFQSKVDALPDEPTMGNYGFKPQYAEWRRAFEKAADRGAVCFH